MKCELNATCKVLSAGPFRPKLTLRKQEYSAKVNEANKNLLRKLDGKSAKEFNVWFNKMFEKVKVGDEEDDFGYGEWYKKEEVKENRKVSLSEFGREFELKLLKN